MAKTALRKDIFREIKKTRSRFLSILCIVGLGAGFFTSVKAAAPSMCDTADRYFNQYQLMDLKLLSTAGFDDEDVAAVLAEPGVEQIMPAYSLDALSEDQSGSFVISVNSLPAEDNGYDYLNQPELVEGRMPQADNECLVLASPLHNKNQRYHPGDEILLLPQAGETQIDDLLSTRELTVVGVIKSVKYFAHDYGNSTVGDGSVDLILYLPETAFTYERYTELYLTVAGHQDFSAYSDQYITAVEELSEKLEALGEVRYTAYMEQLMQEYHDASAEFYQETDKAKKELADARLKLEDAALEIADAEQALQDGWQEYHRGAADAAQRIADAEATVAAYQEELADGWQQLSAGKEALAENRRLAEEEFQKAEAELQEAKNQLDSMISMLPPGYSLQGSALAQYEAGLQQYNDGVLLLSNQRQAAEAQFAEAERQLSDSEQQLLKGEQELSAAEEELQQAKIDAETQLNEGKQELLDGEEELSEAKEQYEEGLLELSDGEAEANQAIADGEAELHDAYTTLLDLQEGQWYVFDREDAVNEYKEYTDDVARVDAIARIFPVFFLLVAALVCLTTMSRMVEEQRTQMGTYKALGYSKGAIAKKFIFYALIAGGIGCLLGQLLFINLIPRIIANSYQILYKFPDMQLSIPWGSVWFSTLSGLSCTMLVAIFCCMKELKTPTAQLMRPKAPKVGKTILLERCTPLWNRLNFSHKITARNLFRYKSRLFMTILGIGGSMSLMVAGFGLQDAILPLTKMQFGRVCTYDAVMVSTVEYDDTAAIEMKDQLLTDPRIASALMTYQLPGEATSQNSDKRVTEVSVFVPHTPEDLTNIINTYDYKTKELLTLTDDSVFITQKMAEQLNVFAGDTLVFHHDGNQYSVTVTHVIENYIYHYIYLTPAAYARIFGEAPVYNAAFLRTDKEMLEQSGGESAFTTQWLKQNRDLLSITFIGDAAASFDNLMSSLNNVVLVLIVCAGLLAFIVVYNLTNVNISERLREIATIKVLGFNHKEVDLYIFRENIIMSIIGILLGIFGGYGLTMFIVYTVEVDIAMFVRKVEWNSYLISALLTASFTFLVNFMMSKKVRKISMVESLKAVE